MQFLSIELAPIIATNIYMLYIKWLKNGNGMMIFRKGIKRTAVFSY